MKLLVHEIKKSDIRIEAVRNRWTAYTVAAIRKIVSLYLNSDAAQSVLLFFKEDTGRNLHAYMPIISEDNEEELVVKDFEVTNGTNGIIRIIGVEPYTIKIDTPNAPLREENINDIVCIMKDNFWNGYEAFRISNKGNYQKYEIGKGFGHNLSVMTRTGKKPFHIYHENNHIEHEDKKIELGYNTYMKRLFRVLRNNSAGRTRKLKKETGLSNKGMYAIVKQSPKQRVSKQRVKVKSRKTTERTHGQLLKAVGRPLELKYKKRKQSKKTKTKTNALIARRSLRKRR